MEFYSKCPTIISAIGESFKILLKHKKILIAKINKNNQKSIKIAKALGFKITHKDDEFIYWQFNKENWRYNKRFNLASTL